MIISKIMSVIKVIKQIEVDDFRNFCDVFNIKTTMIAGDNGSDEELIIEELDKITNQKWVVNFINNNSDGYFRLQMM
ncbi:MAG: hypothetical protein NTW25_02615 [Candidatus Kapabacteria bacterium]|nr:hypothetical protein [Candidatus Kapabacteria bacterium]